MLLGLAALALCASNALAKPVPGEVLREPLLQKRAAPNIADGFTPQQRTQIEDAIHDAQQMASYMATLPRDTTNPIMGKYFDEDYFEDVIAVFNIILGRDPGDPDAPAAPGGNPMLSNILITPDKPHPVTGELRCKKDSSLEAELRFWDTDKPEMILCNAAFTHGGISKGYGDESTPELYVPAVQCDNFDEQVSWKMEPLGMVLLHEYTHYKNLVQRRLGRDTGDYAYGPWGTRQIKSTDKAVINGDSYAWCATEMLWTTLCKENEPGNYYAEPGEPDEIDPGCGMKKCTIL